MLPNFLIAGAAKSGSSSLYYYLSLHKDIYMCKTKEPAFFTKYYDRGINWYKKQFNTVNKEKMIGEATVEYMVDPFAYKRIYKHIPNIKLIFIIRNPIDRAWSHYWHRVKNGEETRSFDEIIFSEKIMSEYIIQYGLYFKLLERFFNIFPKENIKIVVLEEAKVNFQESDLV